MLTHFLTFAKLGVISCLFFHVPNSESGYRSILGESWLIPNLECASTTNGAYATCCGWMGGAPGCPGKCSVGCLFSSGSPWICSSCFAGISPGRLLGRWGEILARKALSGMVLAYTAAAKIPPSLFQTRPTHWSIHP